MARKSFRVQIELEIQSVTCPGVWLCPNGKVSLQVYMLDSCIQTAPLAPVFPLFIDERFVFYKTFASINKLVELQRTFNRERLYAELIQWQDCEMGNVLSTFETSLTDFLFPSSCDVDLLMEPTRNYPGIISPKIEICTKTTIDEVCTVDKCKSNSYVVNPKTISSQQCRDSCPRQQKKVCHSVPYHRQKLQCGRERAKQNQPQFFTAVKPDDSLILRKPQGIGPSCSCDSRRKTRKKPLKRFPQTKKTCPRRPCDNEEFLKCLSSVSKRSQCGCSDGHEEPSCRICENYKKHFDNLASPCPGAESVDELRGKITTENRSTEDILCKLKSEIEQDIDKLMCTGTCTTRKPLSSQTKRCSVESSDFGKCMSTHVCCKPRKCLCPRYMRKKPSSNTIWERKNFVGRYSPKCPKGFKKVIPSLKPCKSKKRNLFSDCCKLPPKCSTKQTFCDRISPHNSSIENMDCNVSKSCKSVLCCDSDPKLDFDDDDDECDALISKYCPQKRSCPEDNNNESSSWCCSPKTNVSADCRKLSESLGLDISFGNKYTSSEPRFNSFCVQNFTTKDTENPFDFKTGEFFCKEIPSCLLKCDEDDISTGMELNSCKSLCRFENKRALRSCLSDTCNTDLTTRTHPFQKQIEFRSKPPCLKSDWDTAWCPYYGTPCTSNKMRALTDKTQDNFSRPCTVVNNCQVSYCDADSDDCDNDNASSDSLDNKSIRKYFDERKKFTDSLNRFCDSLYRKIQYNYGKLCEDNCNCCEY